MQNLFVFLEFFFFKPIFCLVSVLVFCLMQTKECTFCVFVYVWFVLFVGILGRGDGCVPFVFPFFLNLCNINSFGRFS